MRTVNYLLKSWLGVAALLIVATLASCSKEQPVKGNNIEGDKTSVTFSLELPNKSNGAATRALSLDDENAVEAIDVLVFEPNGGKYLYKASAASVATDGGDSKKKTFTVTLITGNYDLMVLANSRAVAGDVISDPVNDIKNKNRQQVEVLLKTEVTGKWVADASRPFPMWGMKENIAISSTTSITGANSVKMNRMVARVDVTVTAADFELTSVHVYNWNNEGTIVPDLNYWDGSDPTQPKATRPNVPSTSLKDKANPLIYAGAEINTVDNKIEREMYLLEAANYAADNVTLLPLTDRTCIVIGGKFNGAVDPTYYRIDFANKVGNQWVHLNILRNHLYAVGITEVKGEGFTTPEEAFNSEPINIEAEVIKWNDAGVGDVIFDGQYHLAIRPSSEFEFGKSAETQIAQIKTDYPLGWEVTKITEVDGTTVNSGWLTTDKAIGALQTNNVFVPMDLTVTLNDTGLDRVGYVYVKAGRMDMRIMVTQTLNSNLSLVLRNHVTLTEFQEYTWITEPSVTPLDVDIDLLWGPRQSDVFVFNDKGEMTSSEVFLFDQASGYDAIAPGNSTILGGSVNPGTKRFVIRPKSVSAEDLNKDIFYDKSSKIEFIVNDGISGVLKKIINLRHWVGPKVIAATDKLMYDLAPNSTGTITVRSNTDFTVEISTEAGNNPMTSGGTPCVTFDNGVEGVVHTPNIAGTALGFTLGDDTPDSEINLTTIKIIIKSPAGLFSDVTVNFDASLLIWVGSNGYAPAKSDSGNAAFFDAAALCPTGYILPTTAIVNAWKTSHYELPSAGNYWTSEYGFRGNADFGVNLGANSRTIYEYGKFFNGSGGFSFLNTRNNVIHVANYTGFVDKTAVLWSAWTSEYQYYRLRDNYGGLYDPHTRTDNWGVPGNHYYTSWAQSANGVTANVRCVKKVI